MEKVLNAPYIRNNVWHLSPEMRSLYRENRLTDRTRPKSANSTNPINETDVKEMFTFYWPGHILKIQNALWLLFNNGNLLKRISEADTINIIDIASGPATGSLAFTDLICCLIRQTEEGTNRRLHVNYILTDVSSVCTDFANVLVRRYYQIAAEKNYEWSRRVRLGSIHRIVESFPECIDSIYRQDGMQQASLDVILVCNALDLLILRRHSPPQSWGYQEFALFRGGAFCRLQTFRHGMERILYRSPSGQPFIFILQEKKYMDLVDLVSPGEHIPVYRPFMYQQGYRPDMPTEPFPISYGFCAYHLLESSGQVEPATLSRKHDFLCLRDDLVVDSLPDAPISIYDSRYSNSNMADDYRILPSK